MHTRGEPTSPPIHSSHRGLSKKTHLNLEVISQAWEKEGHARKGSPRHEDAVDPSITREPGLSWGSMDSLQLSLP